MFKNEKQKLSDICVTDSNLHYNNSNRKNALKVNIFLTTF